LIEHLIDICIILLYLLLELNHLPLEEFFEFVENAMTKSPKSTVATDVIRKLGQEDFAAARGFTVKDALDGKR
jgi:hypothetical protein